MRFTLVSCLLAAACGLPPDEAATTRQALDVVTGFGTNPGNLLMYRYVPAGLPRGRPLVVLLHGCGDTAASFSTQSGFEPVALQRQFALVVPQQQGANNVQGCFNWFETVNQQRGSGELVSIEQMVDRMVADVGSDPARTVVVGFSAGGAEAANLLATSPGRFRAGVIVGGIPFKCGESVSAGFTCMSGGTSLTAQAWAQRVTMAAMPYTGPWPRVAVWHGLSDAVVAPSNRTELVKQWTAVHGVDQTADGTMAIASGGTRSFFREAGGGAAVVELNEVPGFGHGWRTAWATDMADFLGLTAMGGGSAGGGSAGGGSVGGGVAGGGVAGGGSAGGGSAGGGVAGGGSAGGGSVAGGGVAGGAVAAGGTAGGGSAGGGASQSTGCQSCSSGAGAPLLLALLAFRRQRAKTTRTSKPSPVH
jgi:poly(hydroxyalkanoate) depolymerase family esterase